MLTGEPHPSTVHTQNFRTNLIQDEAAARRSPVQHLVERFIFHHAFPDEHLVSSLIPLRIFYHLLF